MKKVTTDIKNINICDFILESIESFYFGKIFSLQQPFNLDTIKYFEYLFLTNKHDIIKLYLYLPDELFETVFSTISHFDVEERKDYVCGSKVYRTERFHKFNSATTQYIDVNDVNFENFITISKIILDNNLGITYESYVESKSKPKIYVSRRETDDSFYKVEKKLIYYYELSVTK